MLSAAAVTAVDEDGDIDRLVLLGERQVICIDEGDSCDGDRYLVMLGYQAFAERYAHQGELVARMPAAGRDRAGGTLDVPLFYSERPLDLNGPAGITRIHAIVIDSAGNASLASTDIVDLDDATDSDGDGL